MSAPRTPGTPAVEGTVRTRRSVLAGGVAGALGATVLAPSASEAQTGDPDPRYVLRERMPLNVQDFPRLTGETQDAPRIQRVIDQVEDQGGGTVFLPPGDYIVNTTLVIPPDTPIRLLGSGATLNSNGTIPWPTRLIRTSGGATVITAFGSGSNRVWFELSDLEVRGSGTVGDLVDVRVGNTCQFHRVNFAGTAGIGLRMRNVYNSSGSHLRWHACGNGAGSPACLFDAVSGPAGGSDTVLWDKLQFEGNAGTDLKLTGDASNAAGTVTTEIQMSQIKMEGGHTAAAACPYIDLDYSQNCKFSDVEITVHGGRTVPPLRKAPPVSGTRADKFVNLTIDSTEGDNFPYGIEHTRGALQLENVTILGAQSAAIRVNSSVGASEFQLGKLVTNVGRPVMDSRGSIPTVAAASSIDPPRERLVGVSGSSGSITSITPPEAGFMTTFKFSGGPVVIDGGNLHLARDFPTTADDTLTLVSDGAGWYEVARSLGPVPRVRAFHDTWQDIGSGLYTTIKFNQELPEAGTATEQHTTSAPDNTRLTCRVPGYYAIQGELELAASSLGTVRAAAIRHTRPGSGTTIIGGWVKSPPLGASLTVNLSVSAMYQLAAGDYLELLVFHDAGSPGTNLRVNHPANTYSPELSMAYLSP